ncbi:HpcH/HpaI aldolase family protein [Alicyclobacillus ferrooxydans]|uniref:Aldolase n=1 Tax=Alicyclobacillus ferrooxydans TaxID=471514 RepID=A0A0P9CP56_9BACL|nr:aldolase/citrate lyase family protein [Alicyclobacillus ferrooxydans]KPV40911.1 aldolase [Alicyclobacillus ferrooxydans]
MNNKMKRVWADGASCYKVLGAFIGFPSTPLVEMCAYNGLDVVVIDNEHGLFSDEQVEYMVMAAEAAGITPLVRVVSADPFHVLKALDRGAHGVHVPQIDSKSLAEQVVEAIKYPPRGKRGAAFSMRAARYGTIPTDQYLEEANRETFVCIHIESIKAVENLSEIASVRDIDAWYIGPTDLSVSMGLKGDIYHPELLAAVDVIKREAQRAGVRLGIHVKDAVGARDRFEWGANYVCLTVTSLINRAFHDYNTQSRQLFEPS